MWDVNDHEPHENFNRRTLAFGKMGSQQPCSKNNRADITTLLRRKKRRADMTTLTKNIPNARRMYVHTALGFNFMRYSHLRKLLGFKNRVPGK